MKFKLIFLALVVTSSAWAQVSGNVRTNLINSSKASCLKSYKQASNGADSEARPYCNCVGQVTADVLNNTWVSAVESGQSEFPPKLPMLVAYFCKANAKNFPAQ